jgi:transposase-like protein
MKAPEPTTLQEAIVYFSNPGNCREYLVARRWPNGVTCPRCGSNDVLFLEKYNRWHCRERHNAPQFTLKTGTVMEDSPIGLDKWLTAMWQIVNCKNGISSCEVHRAIGVTQKSAWFMDHRIRFALGMDSGEKLSGHVEADETFIGGKARNMHIGARKRRITGTGTKDKTAVMGIMQRGGKVRTSVVAKDNCGRSTSRALTLLESLYRQPVVSMASASGMLGMTFQGASDMINQFLSLGILYETTGRRRNRLFAYSPYLKVLGERVRRATDNSARRTRAAASMPRTFAQTLAVGK